MFTPTKTLAVIHSARVKSVAFSPLRTVAAMGLHTGVLELVDWRYSKTLRSSQLSELPVRAVTFTSAGLATGSDDGYLRVCDGSTLQVRMRVVAHNGGVRCIVAIPETSIIITGGNDGVIRVWTVGPQINLEGELQGHTYAVTSLSLDPPGTRLISSSMDGTVKAWDVGLFHDITNYRKQATVLPDLPAIGIAQMEAGPFSENDGTLLSTALAYANVTARKIQAKIGEIIGSSGEGVREMLMPHGTHKALFTLQGVGGSVNATCWCESSLLGDGVNPYHTGGLQFIATALEDGIVQIWDTYSRTIVRTFDEFQGPVTTLLYLPLAGLVIAGSEDAYLRVISMSSMTIVHSVTCSQGRIWSIGTITSGADTILGVGCDQGSAFLQYGDARLAYSMTALPNDKGIKMAISGVVTAVEKDGEMLAMIGLTSSDTVSLYQNSQWTVLPASELVSPVRTLEFAAKGRFLLVANQNQYSLVSLMTLKRKYSGAASFIALARDIDPNGFTVADKGFDIPKKDTYYKGIDTKNEEKGLFCFVDEKRRKLTVRSIADNVDVCTLRLNHMIEAVFSGPLLCVAAPEHVTLFDWRRSMSLVCQINVVAKRVVWNAAGDILALISQDETYILALNWAHVMQVAESASNETGDGIDDAVTLIHIIPHSVSSLAFNHSSSSVVYTIASAESAEGLALERMSGALYHHLLSDLLNSNEDSNITPEVIAIPGAADIAGIMGLTQKGKTEEIVAVCTHQGPDGELCLMRAYIDGTILEIRQLIKDGRLEEALGRCSELTDNVLLASTLLVDAGMEFERVAEGLTGPQKYALAAHVGRIDAMVTVAREEHLLTDVQATNQLAEKAFRAGLLEDACTIYENIVDLPMAALCAYILGDADRLGAIAGRCTDPSLAYRIAVLLGDDDAALTALKAQPVHPFIPYIYARTHGLKEKEPELLLAWKRALAEGPRMVDVVLDK
ncbi:Coatomer beta' subunit [Giardia muris]|uniref:Beta'-coat protein n=1 Tax=Giardia muris TaxID=5742 RepID=A0A4Z1T4N7_GIAMU|nr:Coatomer beta' subunit [Giardia muris]|eukprot:TNJ28037.1 Coatomer beta' subunit [Giardia muris]